VDQYITDVRTSLKQCNRLNYIPYIEIDDMPPWKLVKKPSFLIVAFGILREYIMGMNVLNLASYMFTLVFFEYKVT
jgi:hypothetical protein